MLFFRHKYLTITKDERFKIVDSTTSIGEKFSQRKKLVFHLENRDFLSETMRRKWLKSTLELSKLQLLNTI